VKGSFTAVIWKDKPDMYILVNVHKLPAGRNVCDIHVKAQKPAIVEDCSR
jgi:hypothetical protein